MVRLNFMVCDHIQQFAAGLDSLQDPQKHLHVFAKQGYTATQTHEFCFFAFTFRRQPSAS